MILAYTCFRKARGVAWSSHLYSLDILLSSSAWEELEFYGIFLFLLGCAAPDKDATDAPEIVSFTIRSTVQVQASVIATASSTATFVLQHSQHSSSISGYQSDNFQIAGAPCRLMDLMFETRKESSTLSTRQFAQRQPVLLLLSK